MDTLLSLRVFREIVECKSFVAAADRLNLSTAMTSKHVSRLEQDLGVRLLNRTTRHLSLTEAGQIYYDQCCEALDILENASQAIGQTVSEPRGTLRVTAPIWLANTYFAALMTEYHQRFPDVVVEMVLENRHVNLTEEGYDLALRATYEPAPNLIARPLTPVEFVLVAAPHYLEQRPPITEPRHIEQHAMILPTYVSMDKITLNTPTGELKIHHTAVFRTNDNALGLELARTGIGMTYLPLWMVKNDLATGRLRQILPEQAFFAPTLYAVYTSRKYLTPKVRSLIDFLVEKLVQPQQKT